MSKKQFKLSSETEKLEALAKEASSPLVKDIALLAIVQVKSKK